MAYVVKYASLDILKLEAYNESGGSRLGKDFFLLGFIMSKMGTFYSFLFEYNDPKLCDYFFTFL